MTEKKEILELNWLRGFAAIAVIVFHYTTRYPDLYSDIKCDFVFEVPYGAAGVNIFFLLSGYLTFFTLKGTVTGKQYALKRLKRLYPEYWICLLISTIAILLLNRGMFVGWQAFFVNITMIQDFIGVPSVDGAYWTLAFELRFYIYVFILLILKKVKHIEQLTITWVGLSFVFVFINPYFGDGAILKFFDYIFMPSCCAPFAAGIFLNNINSNGHHYLGWTGLISSVVLSFLVQDLYYFGALIVGVLFILMIIYLSNNQKYLSIMHKLSVILRPIEFIAEISYPLYLLHQYLGYCILLKLDNMGFTNELFILVPIIVSIFIASIVHFFIIEWRRYYGNVKKCN